MVFFHPKQNVSQFPVFTRPLCVTKKKSLDPAISRSYNESGSFVEVKVQRGDAGVTE